MHHNSFVRLEARLKPFADHISPLTITDSEQIGRPWGEAATDGTLAYGNADVWFSPASRAFAKAVYSASKLVWFQSSAAGLENPFLQKVGEMAQNYTSSHVQSDAIAEWVLWAGFDWFGSGAKRRDAQARSAWERVHFREISATNWLIYGFGHIGEATARRLTALGAHVTGVRRSGGSSPHAACIIKPDAVTPEVIGKADAILFCAPHTPETESMGNAAFFAAMKEGSLFLNVGRGALVDEDALLEALDKGRPAHAALDVTRTEPLPEDNPLWTHPAITLTGHTSALTSESRARNDELFLANLANFVAGRPLKNLISRDAFEAQAV